MIHRENAEATPRIIEDLINRVGSIGGGAVLICATSALGRFTRFCTSPSDGIAW